jgi:hypothetical protein
MFENSVLRRIFGPKRDEVTGGRRKLHNQELHDLYSSPSIIRTIKSRTVRWTWNVARTGEKMNACALLVEKSKGKRPLETRRRRWMDNIEMDLKRYRVGGIAWIDLVQDRDHWRAIVNTVMGLWVR